jgi:hypothetical protein
MHLCGAAVAADLLCLHEVRVALGIFLFGLSDTRLRQQALFGCFQMQERHPAVALTTAVLSKALHMMACKKFSLSNM